MVDQQLDLFATANCDYEEEQKSKAKAREIALQIETQKRERQEFLTQNLTSRQHRLVDYLKDNFKCGYYFSIEELCGAGLGYELNNDPKCHDKCVALGNDIRQINWRIGSRYSIIVKNKKGGAKLCESMQEFEEWKESEMKPLVRKIEYLNNLNYKAEQDGVVALVNLNDRALTTEETKPIEVFKHE